MIRCAHAGRESMDSLPVCASLPVWGAAWPSDTGGGVTAAEAPSWPVPVVVWAAPSVLAAGGCSVMGMVLSAAAGVVGAGVGQPEGGEVGEVGGGEPVGAAAVGQHGEGGA